MKNKLFLIVSYIMFCCFALQSKAADRFVTNSAEGFVWINKAMSAPILLDSKEYKQDSDRTDYRMLKFMMEAKFRIPLDLAETLANKFGSALGDGHYAGSKFEVIQIMRRVLKAHNYDLFVLNADGVDVFTKKKFTPIQESK